MPTVIQTSADLSCVYSTRAFFHLMKEAKDSLYEQMLDKDYKFPSVVQLSQVSSRTQLLCKKYFNQYWNLGGRENTFLNAKKMEKVGLKFLLFFCLFVLCVCVFYFNILFSFCSSLRRKLLLVRSRRSRTSVMKKMLEMMMLVIIHFSCLRS